jgi:N-methylhydantoinase A
MSWTLAIETGGTFTDLFMVGPGGQVHADKVPSTPAAPEKAAAAALARGLEVSGVTAAEVTRVLHGSTVAVNALIERRAAQPLLIATRGFRDMLFIGKQEKTHIYDMFYRKPPPFIDRAHVHEVDERIAPDGTVVANIDLDNAALVIDQAVAKLAPSTIAICLLHAYANPSHEHALRDLIKRHHPSLNVVLSSDVCPVHREFERASTTVINALLHPVVDQYLQKFEQTVAAAGCRAAPLIMQANGGVLPVPATRARPAGLFLSGPCAAVAGAASLSRQVGLSSLITVDVGGTSTDICLVTDGEVHESGHGGACGEVQGQPLNMVMTDIVTIGAGGGSLAWVDAGGMLHVGPRSAGADPGPACYGRGGDGYTLTDAMLSLGLLAHGSSLPGGITLSLQDAQRAAQPLLETLELSLPALAKSVYRIAIANMAEAIRSVTVRRGFDPRDYVLFACGGAGPLMCAPLAEELQIAHALIPPDPGVFSAFGLTAAGLRMDFARAAEFSPATSESDSAVHSTALQNMITSLKAESDDAFTAGDVAVEHVNQSFTADARYMGQGFELRVPFSANDINQFGTGKIAETFHAVHARRFGHAFEDQSVELTAIRLNATVLPPQESLQWLARPTGETLQARSISTTAESQAAQVVERADVNPGHPFNGPALCVEPTTTTYVPPDWSASTDANGMLHLKLNTES